MKLAATYVRLIRPWPFWNTNVTAWIFPQGGLAGRSGGAIAGTAVFGMFMTFIIWGTEYALYLYWVLFVTAVWAYLAPTVLLIRWIKAKRRNRAITRVRNGVTDEYPLLPHVRSLATATGHRALQLLLG